MTITYGRGEWVGKGKEPRPVAKEVYNRFANLRVFYFVNGFKISASLKKVDLSDRNDEPIGYYDLKYTDPKGARWVQTFIWAFRNGQPQQIKAFDARRR